MTRTEDMQFAAYLHAQRVPWVAIERNRHGRTDFVYDLIEEELQAKRVEFGNSFDVQGFSSSLEFVQRTVKDTKRNAPRKR